MIAATAAAVFAVDKASLTAASRIYLKGNFVYIHRVLFLITAAIIAVAAAATAAAAAAVAAAAAAATAAAARSEIALVIESVVSDLFPVELLLFFVVVHPVDVFTIALFLFFFFFFAVAALICILDVFRLHFGSTVAAEVEREVTNLSNLVSFVSAFAVSLFPCSILFFLPMFMFSTPEGRKERRARNK